MKKIAILITTLCILSIIIGLLAGSCSSGNTADLKVVTSTSLMEYIVKQVGGDDVEAFNLVPPNQHPGNFDVKPDDIQRLSTAKLFLLHGWPGETYVDKLVTAANNTELKVIKVTADGNWMIPTVQSSATDKVMNALSETNPANSSAFQKAAEAYKKRIQDKESDLKNRLNEANVSQTSVIASARQADFLKWAGFNVVATFVSAQSLTPQVVKDLVDQGRAAGVKLVVNNLQDGEDAGKAVAEDIGAENINLSNFPGGFNNTDTWEKAIDHNVTLLLNAIR